MTPAEDKVEAAAAAAIERVLAVIDIDGQWGCIGERILHVRKMKVKVKE